MLSETRAQARREAEEEKNFIASLSERVRAYHSAGAVIAATEPRSDLDVSRTGEKHIAYFFCFTPSLHYLCHHARFESHAHASTKSFVNNCIQSFYSVRST